MAGPVRIDVHAHVTPPNWEDMRARYDGDWPRIVHDRPGCATLFKGDAFFRAVTDQLFDTRRRLDDMDRLGVDHQLLSPPPDMFCYWAPPAGAAEFARIQNDHIAGVVAKHPDRFYGAGTLPLQDPELAVKELERLRRDLGLHGIAIGTHVNGTLLSDPLLTPVFEAADRLDAPIFVHPVGPAIGADRYPSTYYAITIGYPLDTALAIYAMLFRGTLMRFPRLRLCFAHGGGAFPFLLGRLGFAWQAISDVKATVSEPPTECLGSLYYDSITHHPSALRFLLETLGADHIVMGSDYPFAMGYPDPVAPLESLSDAARTQVMGANAARFLGVGG